MSIARSTITAFALMCTLGACVQACANTAHSRRGDDARKTSRLILEVTPEQAEVYIDERYHGEVSKWVGGVIPLVPGDHQVELRAEGHMPERFDVRMHDGGELVLEVTMEPDLDLPEFEEDQAPPSPSSRSFSPPQSRIP